MYRTYAEQIENAIKIYPDFWDYYRIHRDKSVNDFFDSPNRFIEETFVYAGKKLLAPINNYSRGNYDSRSSQLSTPRAAHSISTFLLGSIIAHDLLDGAFTGLYLGNTDSVVGGFYEFSYIWTLTCLYHDCGYYFEQDKKKLLKYSIYVNSWWHDTVENIDRKAYKSLFLGLNRFMQGEKISQSIWRKRIRSLYTTEVRYAQNIERYYSDELKNAYINSPKLLYFHNYEYPVKFPFRELNIISSYFEYRLLSPSNTEWACIDHGIAGGITFFDNILKNYQESYKIARSINQNIEFNDFLNPNDYNHQMHFSFNQLPVFAYIADCIINHNIWSARPGTIEAEVYSRFFLDSLIGENYHKVNFYENPLLFILAVADSIEPYKLFSNCSIDGAQYHKKELFGIINNTYINIDGSNIHIKPPENCMNALTRRIDDMKNWIDIKADFNFSQREFILQPIR